MLQCGWTALFFAVMKSQVNTVKVLVNCGAAVDIRNKVAVFSSDIGLSFMYLAKEMMYNMYIL